MDNIKYRYVLLLFILFQSFEVLSQDLFIVNAKCEDMPIVDLYIGIKNEVNFYSKYSKSISKSIFIKIDSSFDVHQKNDSVFLITPKQYQISKRIFIKVSNSVSDIIYDSVVVDFNYYPLRFNTLPRIPNHSTIKNYEITGLYIIDTRYPCDSIINNLKILKYSIELIRENHIIKRINISRSSAIRKLRTFKSLMQPGDLLYAKNIQIESNLGFKYSIEKFLLKTIY